MRQSNENNGNQDPTPTIHPADERRERIGAEVLAHMYAKYGVEFNIVGHDWNRHEDRLTLYPVWGTFENERVNVQRRVIDGEVRFLDSYFGIVIREDFEAHVLEMLSDINLPIKVYEDFVGISFDNIFDRTKTYADYKRMVDAGEVFGRLLNAAFVVSYDGDIENHEVLATQIFDALTDTGFEGGAIIMILPSEGFERVTRSNWDEIQREFSKVSSIISTTINLEGGN